MRFEKESYMSLAHSGIDNLLHKIDEVENKVKLEHPGKKGRVIIANSKQAVDYEYGREINQMEWAVRYLEELKKYL
jgi:hypothetical protein